MSGAMGPKDYGVLLTDRRTIFVLERASKALLMGVIGDALVTDKKTVDYSCADLESLVAEKKNIVILHHDIDSFAMKKKLASYTLLIEHRLASGKSRSIKAMLVPPQDLIKAKTRSGLKKAQVVDEYAKSVMRAFELVLPPTVVQKGEWCQ
jgi:hypothetical protein